MNPLPHQAVPGYDDPEVAAAAAELVEALAAFGAARERLHDAVQDATDHPALHSLLSGGADLTARELDIIGAIGSGATNDDIARHFFLGINSLKTYVRQAYRKIHVRSRSEAVRWAIDHGLDAPDMPRRDRTHAPGKRLRRPPLLRRIRGASSPGGARRTGADA